MILIIDTRRTRSVNYECVYHLRFKSLNAISEAAESRKLSEEPLGYIKRKSQYTSKAG